MFSQVYGNSTLIRNLFSLPLYTPVSTIEVTAHDLGYELNEAELASEILAQLPSNLLGQTTPEVDPEEFEAVYGWFLS